MKTRVSRKVSNRGIALMIVMLVIFALSVLVAGLAYTMKVEMRLARNYDNDVQMEWLGRSGIEMARYVLMEKEKIPGQANVEGFNQKWAGGPDTGTNDILSAIDLNHIELGENGAISIEIKDLERKFNINFAANPQVPQLQVFQNAFTVMGADTTLGASVTDCILDWVDADDTKHLSGAENDYYKELGYLCKNADLDDISELLLIKGIWDHPELYYGPECTNHSITAWQQRIGNQGFMDPASQPPPLSCGLKDLFSVMGNQQINVNTADEKVLMLLPGMDPGSAANLIGNRKREGIDVPYQNLGEALMCPGLSPMAQAAIKQYGNTRSHNFEVKVEATMGDYKRTFYGVLRRGGRDFQLIKFYWE